MKKQGTRILVVAALALSLVLAIGGIASADQKCATRWGEPIGLNCETLYKASSIEVAEVAVGGEIGADCQTRWGEPIGIGCRTAYTVTASVSQEQLTDNEVYQNCPTRWGEPIGIGCRVPAAK